MGLAAHLKRTVGLVAVLILGAAVALPATGGGHDGLTPSGVNLNQGAESTLAMLATAQQARRLSELE